MTKSKNRLVEMLVQVDSMKQALSKMKKNLQNQGRLEKSSDFKNLLDESLANVTSVRNALTKGYVGLSYLESDKGIELIKKNLGVMFESMPLDAFLERIAQIVRGGMSNRHLYSNLESENIYLRSKLFDDLRDKSDAYITRTGGRDKRFDPDNQRLAECLSELEAQLGRKLVGTDYLRFTRLVHKKYPEPLRKQAPRLTKEEKTLPPEEQQILRELKMKPGWNEGRLYKFFEDLAQVKPTKKKTISVK